MCCCSFIGQILFGAIMLVATGLTVASIFTPGWTDFQNTTSNAVDDLLHMKFPESVGIFPFLCQMPGGGAQSNGNPSSGNSFEYCKDFWESLPTWEKVVAACMLLALLTELVSIVITLVSICACCCKQLFVFALPILSLLASIFLTIAVAVFGINNKDFLGDVSFTGNVVGDANHTVEAIKKAMTTEIGYSFYLAIGALIATVIDTIVGGLVKCLATKCL